MDGRGGEDGNTAAVFVGAENDFDSLSLTRAEHENAPRKQRKTGGTGITKKSQTLVAKKAPSPEMIAAMAAEATALEEDVLHWIEFSASGSCTCVRFKVLSVKRVRKICCDSRISVPTMAAAVAPAAAKAIQKNNLLVALCPVCKNVNDVRAIGGAEEEGIANKFWLPPVDQAQLSIVDAFHLAMMRDIAAFDAASPIFYELNRFRAHIMAHIVSNFQYYVQRGLVNRQNGKVVAKGRK